MWAKPVELGRRSFDPLRVLTRERELERAGSQPCLALVSPEDFQQIAKVAAALDVAREGHRCGAIGVVTGVETGA